MLRERGFVPLLLGTFAAFAGYALLLPVAPLWAVHRGEGEFVAGASTGVFMGSTVLAQFAVPALTRRVGYRMVAALGAVLLGAPAPVLIVATAWPGMLGVALLRGVGFGLVTVCGSALVAELLPRGVLARGSGLYGLAVGLPQPFALPAGTWAVEHWGFAPVFILAGVVPLLGTVAVALLPRIFPGTGAHDRASLRATVVSVWRPWLVLLSGSIGFGALATFLPIVYADAPTIAAVGLCTTALAALLARVGAGVLGDRIGAAGRMLPLASLAVGVGMLGLAVTVGLAASGVFAIAAVTAFGIGFGMAQNDSLVAMFARTSAGPASVGWNVAFDAGQGLGAVTVGAMVSATSFPAAFGLLAGFAVALLPVVWRVRASVT